MAFAYLLVAFGSTTDTASQTADRQGLVGLDQDLQKARGQYARGGGVAIEFCIHIGKLDVLFENAFSKFVGVGQKCVFTAVCICSLLFCFSCLCVYLEN